MIAILRTWFRAVHTAALIFTTLVVAGAAMLLVSGSAHAYVLMSAAPGGRLTINLAMEKLIGNLPASIAIAKWNQVGIGPNQDHAFFVAQTSSTSGNCGRDNANEVTWSDTNCGLAFGNSTLAVTTMWVSSGKVIEVDMLFNNAMTWSSYSGPVKYNADGTAINDINRVVLHEMGHAAGLNHPDDAGQMVSAIMNSHISDIDALQADDVAGAHAIAWQSATPGNVPVCSLTASPASITLGGSATIVASCRPAATSYIWANTGFSSETSSGVVSPSVTTTYELIGSNTAGAGATAVVTISVVTALKVPVCTLGVLPAALSVGGSSTLFASCSPAATSYLWTNSGFGTAVSAGTVSPTVTTSYSVSGINAAGAGNPASAIVSVANAAMANYTDLWWAGSAENGWGMSINQHGSKLFAAMYVYDSAGKPVWYVMTTGTWDSTSTTYAGLLYQPKSAPINAYVPIMFEPGLTVGNLSIAFTGVATAALRYEINGISGQKSIQRQLFGYGAAPLNVGDLWWGGASQNGWGISISQQASILFAAWYTYGPDGRNTWYVLPNGSWDGLTYSGPFYSTGGSAWLDAAYDASKLVVTETGTMSLNFTSDSTAIMTYSFTSGPFAGTTQSRRIERQVF